MSKYKINKVIDQRRAAATKVGGSGIRYTIIVSGHQTFLFEDEGKWFVESRVPVGCNSLLGEKDS